MAIHPRYITCTLCGAPNAFPYDFLQTAGDRAEMDAERQRRRDLAQQGWTGPQFISHASRALLCSMHHDRADALGLHRVPIQEALARLRDEA